MNKNATAAAVDADEAAQTDEAAFAEDAEDELRAAEDAAEDPGDEACDAAALDEDALDDEMADAALDAGEEASDDDGAAPDDDAPDESVGEDALDEALDDDAPDEALDGDALDEALDGDAPDEALDDDAPDEALDGDAPDEALDGDAPDEALDDDVLDDDEALDDLLDDPQPDLPPAAEDDATSAQDDASDVWRAHAAHLRAAGLASHVIHLSNAAAEDENLALEPLLDLASGALFRLSPGRFAAMLDDPDAAAQAVGDDVALEEIADAAQEDDAAPDGLGPEALALVAPMAEAALQAGGPRVVIDADFALAAAARTAEGIARITGDAAESALARIETRLAQTEAALEALLAAATAARPVEPAATDAPAADLPEGLEARLAAHIDASVDRAVAAVRADILKSARARRDADRRALEPAISRLDAASGALEEDRRVSAGRNDAYAETIRAIVGELLARGPAKSGDAS